MASLPDTIEPFGPSKRRRLLTPRYRRLLHEQLDRMSNLKRRLFTSPDNPLPDCLLIGAKRAGTSSLYQNMIQHPRINAAGRKEVHYFDLNHHLGPNWYRSFFAPPTPGEPTLNVDATPYYLFHPAVPARVKALLPDARFIALLRDPVERAWSEYMHSRQRGLETLGFSEAIEAEGSRLRGEEERILADPRYLSHAHRYQAYQARGLYARQLARWFEHFPRDRFLLLQAEDLQRNPAEMFGRVVEFLGLPNTTSIKPHWQNSTRGKSDMPAADRDRLRRFFEPANAELRAIAGLEFDWN
ncbi:MAG: sulfotransferase [Sphingomonadales bacterium]